MMMTRRSIASLLLISLLSGIPPTKAQTPTSTPIHRARLAQVDSQTRQTIQGRLATPDAEGQHSIRGVAGDLVIISVTSSEFSPLVRIYNNRQPWFLELNIGWQSSGEAALILWTLPFTGDYTIQVEGMGEDEFGAYRLEWITGSEALTLQPHIQAAQAILESNENATPDQMDRLAEILMPYWGSEHPYVQQLQQQAASLRQEVALQEIFQALLDGSVDTAVTLLDAMIQQIRADSPDPAITALGQRLDWLISTRLSEFYGQSGDLPSADNIEQITRLYENTLALYERSFGANHPLTEAWQQSLLGWYQLAGDVFRAERLLTDQPQVAQSQATEFNALVTQVYAHTVTGNLDRAETLLRQGLETVHTAREQAYLQHWLASLIINKGEAETALQLLEETFALAESTLQTTDNNEDIWVYEAAVDALANGYVMTGRYAQAEQLLEQAEQLSTQLPGYSQPQMPSLIRARLYRGQGAYTQAETIFREYLELGSAESADILNALAEVLWVQGKVEEATQVRHRALVQEEAQIARALSAATDEESRRFLSRYDLQLAYSATISASLSASNYSPVAALGLTQVLQRKGRVLDLLATRQQYIQGQLSDDDRNLLDQLEAARSQLSALIFQPNAPDDAQHLAAVQNLQTEISRLEADLTQNGALSAENLSQVTAATVQPAIPDQAALVEYVRYQAYDPQQPSANSLGAPRYLAYVLHPQGNVAVVDLGDAATLDGLVAQVRQQLQDGTSNLAAVQQAGHALYQAVIAPLPLGNAQHLLLAPDGQLNLVPFAALVDGQQQYLVETHRLTYLTSGRDLLRRSTGRSSHSPVLVANPDYEHAVPPSTTVARRGSSDRDRAPNLGQLTFSSLLGTALEVEALAQLLPNGQVLTDTEATETTLKQIQAPQILHIATHGFFLPDIPLAVQPAPLLGEPLRSIAIMPTDPELAISPAPNNYDLQPSETHPLLRSGLVFAGVNRRQSGRDDGVLTALEASGLNLQGTQLVVLSACETGIGNIATGEGVYGLRRAFTLAGAASQLTSLWQVDDTATKDLMINYYQRLLLGEGRSEALRQAQLQVLQHSTYQHPYYWASFVFSGDWTPLTD